MNLPWIPQTTINVPEEQPADVGPLTKLKLQWASLIASAPDTPHEHYMAARRLFPRDEQEGMCQDIANRYSPSGWINDPIVMGELSRLKREQDGTDLPNKIAIGRQLLNMAENTRHTVADRLKAYNQYCELMGLKPTKDDPLAGGVGTYIDNRRMFVVPAPLGNEDFTGRAREIRAKQIEAVANKTDD